MPEMTQWYTVCLSSRVNFDLHGKILAFKFTNDISDDLCFAIVFLITIAVLLISIAWKGITCRCID